MTILDFLTKSYTTAERLLASNLHLSYTFRQAHIAINLTTEVNNEIHHAVHYEPIQALPFLSPSAFATIISDMETNLRESIECQQS